MSRIAFIGLGHMGGPMAANLLKAGHALHVFDLVPAPPAPRRRPMPPPRSPTPRW
jgi:3-hydroxyisobutyrate dehydrogenase-like beta-hydroxyacid dehydrogenase